MKKKQIKILKLKDATYTFNNIFSEQNYALFSKLITQSMYIQFYKPLVCKYHVNYSVYLHYSVLRESLKLQY